MTAHWCRQLIETSKTSNGSAMMEDTSQTRSHPSPPQADVVRLSAEANLVDVLRRRASQQGERVAFRFLPGAGRRENPDLSCVARARRQLRLNCNCGSPQATACCWHFRQDWILSKLSLGAFMPESLPCRCAQPGRRRPVGAIQAICASSKPSLVLGTAERAEPGTTSTAELSYQVELPWLATDRMPTERLGQWHDPQIHAQQTAFLQYTSGSTSSPKGVIVSHENLLSNAALIQQAFGTSAESSAVFWLPLYHDMGLIGGVIQPVYCGGTCTLLAPAAFLQRPALWLETVSRMRATISGGPDFAFALCARKVSEAEREGLDLQRLAGGLYRCRTNSRQYAGAVCSEHSPPADSDPKRSSLVTGSPRQL